MSTKEKIKEQVDVASKKFHNMKLYYLMMILILLIM